LSNTSQKSWSHTTVTINSFLEKFLFLTVLLLFANSKCIIGD
jgi:hypothetical protein